MKYFIVLSVLACVLAVVCASSYNYAQAARGGRRSPSSRRSSPIRAAAAATEDNEQPTPYQFNYNVDDGESKQERQEEGDGSGAVKGSYSYMDANGIYRTVTYIADQDGFRASISSNEPGLGTTDNPADVTMDVKEPPAGAYESSAKPRKSKKKSRNYY